jgi:hypothetical protein
MQFKPGDPVLYMKVGTHAQEDLGEILERKRREIADAGFAMWGYGGNTCHPTSMVQPFAKAATQPIILCMQPMQSRHFAEQVRAEEYSADGIKWRPIPRGINVLGSRYALCIDTLEEVSETLNLADTRVAIGKSRGRSGQTYIRGRVDKACLEIVSVAPVESESVDIKIVAKIVDPYAVLLRS